MPRSSSLTTSSQVRHFNSSVRVHTRRAIKRTDPARNNLKTSLAWPSPTSLVDMQLTLLASTVTLVLAVSISISIYRVSTSPLYDVPGPLLARFTRFWFFGAVYSGQAHHKNIHLHRKYARGDADYAPVVRLAPNMYSIDRPERAVYGVTSNMAKSSWYEVWKHPNPERWTIFSDRDIKRHGETRRKFQSLFLLSNIAHFEPLVDEAQALLGQQLERMTRTREQVDIHHWLRCYAFDVIGSITFGERFGFLDAGMDVENCMSSLDASLIYSTLVGHFPEWHPWLYWILEKLPGSGARGRTYLMSMVRRKIAERQAARENREAKTGPTQSSSAKDFLDVALDASEDPQKKMTPGNVFMMGLSNIIAGSDTTAVSLSSILWHLTQTPEAMAKARAELDTAIEEGKMTRSSMPFKEIQRLPYLQACIKEGLRICPATGLPMWRVVPEGGVQMLGHFFPEGTEIGMNVWVAHYNRDIWGTDAEIFRPERWIEVKENPERLKEMENHFSPFGQGSRTCLGRHISYLEICKTVPMIIQNFDLELVRPSRKFKTENFWFVKPLDFQVYVTPRKQTVSNLPEHR